jgi:hypothetical protein
MKKLVANNPAVKVVSFENAGVTITAEIDAFRKNWLASKALN